jgi:hypothetical protein
VTRSLLPIAIGHELSLVLVAVVTLAFAATIPSRALHVGAAIVVLSFGIFRFVKPRAHFRWTTMRVDRKAPRVHPGPTIGAEGRSSPERPLKKP